MLAELYFNLIYLQHNMLQGPTSSPPLYTRNKYQGTYVPCHLYPPKEEDLTPPQSGQTQRAKPTIRHNNQVSVGELRQLPRSLRSHPNHEVLHRQGLLETGLQSIYPSSIQVQPILGEQLFPWLSACQEAPVRWNKHTGASWLGAPFF